VLELGTGCKVPDYRLADRDSISSRCRDFSLHYTMHTSTEATITAKAFLRGKV
jgi:hypothetical protein